MFASSTSFIFNQKRGKNTSDRYVTSVSQLSVPLFEQVGILL